jgi:hypothetical protein
MTRALDLLRKRQYRIEYEEACDCWFQWTISPYGLLECESEGSECWSANLLFAGEELIAAFVRFEGWQFYVPGLKKDDLPDDVIRQMEMPYTTLRGEVVNTKHHLKMREALILFLMQGHYELGRDDLRFRNEYLLFLRPVETPIQVSREKAEKWADDFLYQGDTATQAFVYFELR